MVSIRKKRNLTTCNFFFMHMVLPVEAAGLGDLIVDHRTLV